MVRRPLALGGLAAVALLALATPLLSLHLENPASTPSPTTCPWSAPLEAIEQAFPGGPEPAEVVVTGDNLSGAAVSHAITRPARAGRGDPRRDQRADHHRAVRHGQPASDQVLVISVPLAGNGTDATSVNALDTLRNRVLPATLGKVPGISYAVGGDTASNHDVDAQLGSRTPLVFAFVLGLAFLLLMVSFRSVAIPALSICLNLLSVGAAYGLMTWIFQDGHLQGLLGFTLLRRDHAVAAAVHVRAAVRAEHGLPRVHPQPDQGAAAARRVRPGGGHRRDHLERRAW